MSNSFITFPRLSMGTSPRPARDRLTHPDDDVHQDDDVPTGATPRRRESASPECAKSAPHRRKRFRTTGGADGKAHEHQTEIRSTRARKKNK
jgi:hypothetical protein